MHIIYHPICAISFAIKTTVRKVAIRRGSCTREVSTREGHKSN